MSRRRSRPMVKGDQLTPDTIVRVTLEAPASAFNPKMGGAVVVGSLPNGRNVAVVPGYTYDITGVRIAWDEDLPLDPGTVVNSGIRSYVRGLDGKWHADGQKFEDAEMQRWFDADEGLVVQSPTTP